MTTNLEAYLMGVKDGISAYAVWRDGVQHVGSGLRSLETALQVADKERGVPWIRVRPDLDFGPEMDGVRYALLEIQVLQEGSRPFRPLVNVLGLHQTAEEAERKRKNLVYFVDAGEVATAVVVDLRLPVRDPVMEWACVGCEVVDVEPALDGYVVDYNLAILSLHPTSAEAHKAAAEREPGMAKAVPIQQAVQVVGK